MTNTIFITARVILTLVLIGVLHTIIDLICDVFREGHRIVGFVMIGMIVAIVAIVVTALPWWML